MFDAFWRTDAGFPEAATVYLASVGKPAKSGGPSMQPLNPLRHVPAVAGDALRVRVATSPWKDGNRSSGHGHQARSVGEPGERRSA